VRLAQEKFPQIPPGGRWHYPGIEVQLAEDFAEPCARIFRRHVREFFDLSRLVREAYARLSMVTVAPEQLTWMQRMCHVDISSTTPGECVIASVLYLFEDCELGGTAFFTQRPEVTPYLELLEQGNPGPRSAEFEFFQQAPAYHTGSNEFFQLDQVAEARSNRMIFYRGNVHHSAHIIAPQLLSEDPVKGRLTLNGFYRVATR
jgi:hypothetical protein